MDIKTIMVKGRPVTWAITGGIHMGRDLHDSLREDLQGTHYIANTPREFENVIKMLFGTDN